MEELEFESTSPVVLTPGGYARLKEELDHLTKIKRIEIAERLRESMDHGEFAEDNSELDVAKQEQAIVENRIAELRALFSNVEVLNSDDIPTDHVGLGSLVTVADSERAIEFSLRIVASIEANPDEDIISDESPLGSALLGHTVGEVVEYEAPVGKIKYQIKAIAK
jgi:transcription elongation factor GreA